MRPNTKAEAVYEHHVKFLTIWVEIYDMTNDYPAYQATFQKWHLQ